MLIETKTITELSLSFGNTWVVISATVMGILIMAYLANLSVIKIRIIPTILIYLLLTITLLAGAFLSDANLTFLPFGLNRILKTLILTAPIFFSGMLGGFLEYNAMYLGFKALYLIALAMYALAFFFSRRTSTMEI